MAAWNSFWNPPAGGTGFESNRTGRYDWFWALYWNTAYDNLSSYFANYPVGSKLYRYTRGLRNPVGRYVDFYVANVWGGLLDGQAGNGTETPSALPIDTEDDRLRAAISKVWQWSNWNSKRNLATMYSTTLGDAFLKVVDRPAKSRCYLQVRWPGEVTDVAWDDFGHVKSVTFEYRVEEEGGYDYKEVIEHPAVWGGETTRFRTFKNGRVWAYPENTDGAGTPLAEWTAPYDFVPVVHVPWMDVGQGWGAVGFVKTLRKIDAANALASQLADQVAKLVNTPLVAYGIQASTDVTIAQSDDGVPIMYVNRSPQEADVKPLIGDLNIQHGLETLNAQLDEIKQDLPELRLSEALRSGMSGEALGRAFSDVLAQIQAVRANHDSGLVRAQQMAVAIAGESGYAREFQGFNLTSFAQGQLDHSIGSRPVLPRSTEETIAEEKERWVMVKAAVDAGVPLETALRTVAGWSKQQIRLMQREQEAAKTAEADLTAMMLEEARRKFDQGGGVSGVGDGEQGTGDGDGQVRA